MTVERTESTPGPQGRLLTWLLAALLAILVMAPAARAGTLSFANNTYSYVSNSSAANDVTLRLCRAADTATACTGTQRFVLRDTENITNTTVNCTGADTQFTCVVIAGAAWSLSLGPGNDSLNRDDSLPGGSSARVSSPIAANGEAGDDSLVGGNVDDLLQGGEGNDQLGGLGGVDNLQGGNGDDGLAGGDGADVINGGNAGFDTVNYSTREDDVAVTLDGAANDGDVTDGPPGARDNVTQVERILSGSGNDRLDATGFSLPVTLDSGAGADTLLLGNNGGTASGGPGNDTIAGGAGNDNINGGDGVDEIDGKGGDDSLNGAGGADHVVGGPGADTIEARDGVVDRIDCGADTDTANTDSIDQKVNCELPAPPPQPTPTPAPTPIPTPTPTPKPLKVQVVNVIYGFSPKHPKKTTTFTRFLVRDVSKNSKVVVRCLTKKGKRCKGKLGKTFTKKKARGDFKVKAVLHKYTAGMRIEVIVTKAGFLDQIKIVKIRRNAVPDVDTRCRIPGSTRRRSCGG